MPVPRISTELRALPPSEPLMMEHIDQWLPSTAYQYIQCMEIYGHLPPAPDLATRTEQIKDTVACLMTPDEPADRVPRDLWRQITRPQMESSVELNERFDRLFLTLRRRSRRASM